MPNILLTEECVRSCPYCFAKKYMDSSDHKFISWEDFIYIVDLFERSHMNNQLSLLGGEPSVHKYFTEFILYLINRNFGVTVFTCGIMSQKKLDHLVASLEQFPEHRVRFVVNLNHPSMSTDKELERIDAFLRVLGKYCTLSFNLFTLEATMEYLFEHIERYGINRHIRIGLAHPIPGEKNLCIKPDHFKEMAAKLSSYLPLFIKHNVSAGFDCGFPLCSFTDEQIGQFFKLEKGQGPSTVKFVCSSALDIGPDMTVWSCFPLSRFKRRSIFEFDSVEDIYKYYNDMHKAVRRNKAGIYDECESCIYMKNEKCAGGCLANFIEEYLPAEDLI